LSIVKLNFATGASQNGDSARADAGPELIDKAGDEKRDFHKLGALSFVLCALCFVLGA
jgi:hypothetical protein